MTSFLVQMFQTSLDKDLILLLDFKVKHNQFVTVILTYVYSIFVWFMYTYTHQ